MNSLKVPTVSAGSIGIGVRKAVGRLGEGSEPRQPNSRPRSCPKYSSGIVCRAGSGEDGAANGTTPNVESVIEPDNLFLFKLLGLSTGGALFIKYGSLLIDAPFTSNAPLALGMIYGPTLVFAIWLALRSSESKS
ncbi:hypothetical protein BSKO_02959 [Bryopsis sp. KO-2023]|nr:hypothetical protein BSKO_02959 [Bryopsis sp. KO-2023]